VEALWQASGAVGVDPPVDGLVADRPGDTVDPGGQLGRDGHRRVLGLQAGRHVGAQCGVRQKDRRLRPMALLVGPALSGHRRVGPPAAVAGDLRVDRAPVPAEALGDHPVRLVPFDPGADLLALVQRQRSGWHDRTSTGQVRVVVQRASCPPSRSDRWTSGHPPHPQLRGKLLPSPLELAQLQLSLSFRSNGDYSYWPSACDAYDAALSA